MEEQAVFEGWKLKTTVQDILPRDRNDALVVFEVDTTEHSAEVYHLKLSQNMDLFQYQPCPSERIKNLTPIATFTMQPAKPYTPPPLLKGLEERVVDLRD